MKKMKIFNSILIFISIFCGVCYSLETIFDGDLYGTLIRLSIVPVILLPYILRKFFKIDLSYVLEFVYIIFIFLGHFLGSIVNLYDKVYWYDTFTHFLSGFLVFFIGLEYLIRSGNFNRKNLLFNIIFLMAISFMIAGLWEMFEFFNDKIFGKDAQKVLETGVNDTMKDMIVAVLGTSLCSIFYCFEFENDKDIIFKKVIKSIQKKN